MYYELGGVLVALSTDTEPPVSCHVTAGDVTKRTWPRFEWVT